jgi:transmembrane sensor
MMGDVVTFSDPAGIEAQAREWLIRLDSGTLTAREREALQEWLNRSSAHRAELKRLTAFWNSADVLTELAVPVRRRQSTFAPRAARLSLAAAFAIAIIAAGAWWMLKPQSISSGAYGTALGEQRLLTLEDGSSLQLNTDSHVQVSYRENLREIRLLRGEALFTVSPDAKRPFEVHAANGVVRAVGTAFSVQLEGSEISVAVTHGRVDVLETRANQPPDKRGSLVAGEVTTFHSGLPEIEIQRLPEQELERRLAWHEGYLVFEGEPLSEVVAEVNRYSPTRLEVTDPQLANLAIGGRFRIGDLDAVLDVLHSGFAIDAHRNADGSLRLERSPLAH